MNEAPPRLSGPPWGIAATLALTVVGVAMLVPVSVALVAAAAVSRMMRNEPVDLHRLALDGDLVAWGMILTAPLVAGYCTLVARAPRTLPVSDYLALRRFKLKDLLIGAAALAALLSASALIATLLHEQYNADLILIYGSAKHLVVLWVAIVAAAPLSEELLFRGFMFTGLAESRLGWSGAIALSSIAWTALHLQYDMFQIGEMFVLGIVLGWLRRRSGSIWVPFIIHGLNNLIASYYYTAYSRG